MTEMNGAIPAIVCNFCDANAESDRRVVFLQRGGAGSPTICATCIESVRDILGALRRENFVQAVLKDQKSPQEQSSQ